MSPRIKYQGKLVDMRPGETLRAAYQRQYGQQPTAMAQPAPAAPPSEPEPKQRGKRVFSSFKAFGKHEQRKGATE